MERGLEAKHTQTQKKKEQCGVKCGMSEGGGGEADILKTVNDTVFGRTQTHRKRDHRRGSGGDRYTQT